MMKKIIFFALMLLCSATVVGQVIPSVSTAEQLKAAVERNSSFKLSADINVSGVGKLAETFTGAIYGEGHSITGVTTPLIDTVVGATFRDITFKNCSIRTEENFHCGIIACEAIEGCKFENISIQNSLVNSNTKPEFTNEEYGQYDLAVGTLVGMSVGSTFTSCSVDDQTGVYSVMDAVDLFNFAYLGGLVGHSMNDVYENCVNKGMVSGYNYTGGLAGKADRTQANSCVNAGTIIDRTFSFEDVYFANYKAKKYETSTVVYDGQSYTVQILTEEELKEFFRGGIGLVGATIGGLFGGMADNSLMTKCANLSGHTIGIPIGGLVGECSASVIDGCSNYGSCIIYNSYGRNNKGGIVGKLVDGGTVSNCLNTGSLRFDNDSYGYGSIAGNTTESCKIFNCVSTTPCTIVSYLIHGDISLDANNSGNNYFLKPDVEYNEYLWERGVTEDQFKSGLVAHWLRQLNKSLWKSESCPWRQNIGEDDFPVLDPTHNIVTISDVDMPTISSSRDMYDFFNEVGNGHNVYAMRRLACDIDMSKYPLSIGLPANPFSGIFDGAGHTIYNCNYRQTVPGGNGIFGTVGNGAEIYNLILGEDCTVENTHNEDGAGGIVGLVVGSGKPGYVIIDGCGNYASIYAKSYAGGILGKVDCEDNVKVYVTNCYNVGDIKVQTSNSALLCGYMKNSGVVTNCWSYGQLRTEAASGLPCKRNSESGECYHFVGYDKTLDISNSSTFDSVDKVDRLERSWVQEGVFEYPSQMLKHGTFTFLLNGQKNDPATNTWQQNMGDYPVPGNKGLYHTREVTSQYGTVCLPYALRSNDDIQYYVLNSYESTSGTVSLNFIPATEVAAATPALFHVKTPGTCSFDDAGKGYVFGTSNNSSSDWKMLGTFDQQTFSGTDAESIYYISDGQIRNAQSVTIAPFRAYFSGPNINTLKGPNNQAKALRLVVDGVPTMISPTPALPGGEGAMFSLMGTKVGNGYRGIVIKNGRKTLTPAL